jgi:D-inositol-3-phosphate glycosyltransferase
VKARYQGSRDTSPRDRIDTERRIGQECDQVVATCNDEVRELIALGVGPQQISVVPCGVNIIDFSPYGPVAPRNGRPRLVTVSRLVERKGIDTVLAAMASLPAAELIVAGGSDGTELSTDPDYRRLRRTATELGVADRIVFTGGVARGDVPALLRSADVVVCAPWYEPFGIVPLEAMACGVPVIATSVGGLTDTVTDGETGLLVPPRNAAALAAAAGQLLADPRRRAAFGRAGRQRARRWYSWEGVAERTEAVYLRLVPGRPPQDLRPLDLPLGASSW